MRSLCHSTTERPGRSPGPFRVVARSAPRRQHRGLVEPLIQLAGGGRLESGTTLPGDPALLPPDGEFFELHCPPPAAPMRTPQPASPSPPVGCGASTGRSLAAVGNEQACCRSPLQPRSITERSRRGSAAGEGALAGDLPPDDQALDGVGAL